MRENNWQNMGHSHEEHKRSFCGKKKPLMLDKTQDTTLDQESYKIVPCSCRLKESIGSIIITKGQNYDDDDFLLPQCKCIEEKKKTLLDAAFTGNLDLFELCVEEEADFNTYNSDGDTALHIVTDRGDNAMLNFLLNMKKININSQNVNGLTPLSVAISTAHDDSARILLEHGADPNIADNNGKTPIILSVGAGNAEMTKLLIEFGADVNVMDCFGNTPLTTALIDQPLITLVQVLLSSGANPLSSNNRLNPFLETVLACTSDSKLEMVKAIVEAGVDINVTEPYSGRNCLHLAGINGFLPLAEYLVGCGACLEKVDMSKRNPYDVAVNHNNKEVANFYLKAMLLKKILSKMKPSSRPGGPSPKKWGPVRIL